jgi:hypothetical protein
LLASCGQRLPTARECKALAEPKAVVDRCFGGHLDPAAKYVGDLKCWPFSNAHHLQGVWLLQLETSVFYPNARSIKDVLNQPGNTWLETDLLEKRSDLRAATQGEGTHIYAVDLEGREALCDGLFGHMGQSPHEVIATHIYSIRELPLPS